MNRKILMDIWFCIGVYTVNLYNCDLQDKSNWSQFAARRSIWGIRRQGGKSDTWRLEWSIRYMTLPLFGDVVKSRSGKSKSKSTGRKFKSSSRPSPQVSVSFDLPTKKRQNLSAPYHLTTSTEKSMLEWNVRNTFYTCFLTHSLQSTHQIKHLAAWLFEVQTQYLITSCHWGEPYVAA